MKFIIRKPAPGQTTVGSVTWLDSMDELEGQEIDIRVDQWSPARGHFKGVTVSLPSEGGRVSIALVPEWLYPTAEDYSPLLKSEFNPHQHRFSHILTTDVRPASGLGLLVALKEGRHIGEGQFAFVGGSDVKPW